MAIGAFVVGAVEIEGADRVVRRADRDTRRGSDAGRAATASRTAAASIDDGVFADAARADRGAAGRARAGPAVRATQRRESPAPRRRPPLLRAAAHRLAGRSIRRCTSPRQYESGANRTSAGLGEAGHAERRPHRRRPDDRCARPARSKASARRAPAPPGGGNSVRRNGSRTRPNTRSRRASRSCTASSSSLKPGWPRFSASSSAKRRLRSSARGVLSVAPPFEQIPQTGREMRQRRALPSSGAPRMRPRQRPARPAPQRRAAPREDAAARPA